MKTFNCSSLNVCTCVSLDHNFAIEEDLNTLDDDGVDGSAYYDFTGELFRKSDYNKPLLCYSCVGETEHSTCNMALLTGRPLDYITQCTGYCINVSIGNTI